MGFLKLITGSLRFLMEAPFKFMRAVDEFIFRRLITRDVLVDIRKETKELGKAGRFFRFVGIVLLYLLFVALLVGAMVGLWYVNDYYNLERVLGGPAPMLRPYWLPILFALLLVSAFVGIRLFRSLGPDRLDVAFPDLDEAWTEIRVALLDAGIVMQNVPIFLVLGRNASNLNALLTSSRLTFAVQQVPLKPNAPLQVYASKQAIYVVAPDASSLGKQAELLYQASADAAAPPPAKSAAPSVFEELEPPPADLLGPEDAPVPAAEPFPTMDNLLADPGAAAAPVALLTEPEKPKATPWQAADRPRMPALLKRTDEAERCKARLAYLARRIERDRSPYCPLNGILLLIPFHALANDEDASQIASVCEADLRVLHDCARTRCPVIVLVTDLESAPGYASMAERLDADRRARLFGLDLPLIPDLKASDLPLMTAGGVHHFGNSLSQWVYRLLRVEQSSSDSAALLIGVNAQLYELLGSIRQRENALERVLSRITTADPPLEMYLAGFYLAATGTNPDMEQAFVPGIFQQLMQNQNAVAWTHDALTEDADYQRWTNYGYIAIVVFVVATAAIMYGRWQILRW